MSEKLDNEQPLLKIESLRTYFSTKRGIVKAVDGVNLSLKESEVTCLLGESGSGKTVTALSVLGLIDSMPGIVGGRIFYRGHNLLCGIEEYTKQINSNGREVICKKDSLWSMQHKKNMEGYRGRKISLVFQDPMSSLHPLFTVGHQLTETILRNKICSSKKEAAELAIEWLRRVRLPNPENIMKHYSFEMSGGMAQRVMMAFALCTNPELLIADEPTTALDATIQLEILNLLRELQISYGLTVLLITHDIAIAANYAQKIAVMYSGHIVEYGEAGHVFSAGSAHPYTKVLLEAARNSNGIKRKQKSGNLFSVAEWSDGCKYHPKCSAVLSGENSEKDCFKNEPPEVSIGETHFIKCWRAIETSN